MKFFSKKIVLIAITAVIVLSGVLVIILVNRTPKFKTLSSMPAAISVSGNGGPAVMVDNYLYFVGGYVDASGITYKQNDYYYKGKVPDGAIYRVKLYDGIPEYEYDNNEYDENGEKIGVYDPEDEEHYNKKIVKTEELDVVVPKIAGHGAAALWVYGDTLVYSSPNNLKNKVGELQNSRLDFFCVDLNGKNHKKIYTSEGTNLTTGNFSVVWAGNPYLLINDSGTLKRISMSGSVNTIAENVTGVTFPKVTDYRERTDKNQSTHNAIMTLQNSFSGMMQFVYYTTARDDSFSGNKMYRYNFADGGGNSAPVASDANAENGKTYTPKTLSDGRFLFTVKGSATNDPTLIYISSKETDDYAGLSTVQSATNELRIFNTSLPVADIKFYVSSQSSGNLRVLAIHNNKLYLCTASGGEVKLPEPNAHIYGNAGEVVLALADRIYVKYESYVKAMDYSGSLIASGAADDGFTGVSVSSQNSSMPISIFQPFQSDGDPDGDGYMTYILTSSGVTLANENGRTYSVVFPAD
jgi:hypothetical protein